MTILLVGIQPQLMDWWPSPQRRETIGSLVVFRQPPLWKIWVRQIRSSQLLGKNGETVPNHQPDWIWHKSLPPAQLTWIIAITGWCHCHSQDHVRLFHQDLGQGSPTPTWSSLNIGHHKIRWIIIFPIFKYRFIRQAYDHVQAGESLRLTNPMCIRCGKAWELSVYHWISVHLDTKHARNRQQQQWWSHKHKS